MIESGTSTINRNNKVAQLNEEQVLFHKVFNNAILERVL